MEGGGEEFFGLFFIHMAPLPCEYQSTKISILWQKKLKSLSNSIVHRYLSLTFSMDKHCHFMFHKNYKTFHDTYSNTR